MVLLQCKASSFGLIQKKQKIKAWPRRLRIDIKWSQRVDIKWGQRVDTRCN